MKVDMVADAIEPVLSAVFSAKTPEAKQKIVDELFPRYVGAIDKFYSQTKGTYLLGEELSVADLKIACALTMLTDGGMFAIGEPDCLDQYTHVKAAMKGVTSHEKVKAWYAMKA